VFLTDRDLPLQAMQRLRTRFPSVAELKHTPPAGEHRNDVITRQVGQTVSPIELIADFWASQAGTDLEPDQRALLEDAVAAKTGSDA
jgi:exonuclease SbcD